jgi:hypothetical protein
MTTTEGSLHTLTYRVDPTQLGKLALYPLTPAFTSAWVRFATTVKRRAGRDEITPRYSNLATALTAVTGHPVRLFAAKELSGSQRAQGVDALLVTTTLIDPWVLATAVRTFERLSLGDGRADTLAPCLDGIQPAMAPLAAYVDVDDGRAQAPGWLYEAAKWHLAARIASMPLILDGHLPIRLRLDTNANLVAWASPITRTWSTGPRHAMVYLDTSIVTLPGAAHLYLRLDAHVARIPNRWFDVKHAWVACTNDDEDTGPLLHLPVRGPWPDRGRDHPEYRDFVTGILEACRLDPIPTLPDAFPDTPGPVRLIGNPASHPVGRGAGARFILQVQQQLIERLALPEPSYQRTKILATTATTGQIPIEQIDQAIYAAGTDRLRIACLYDSPLTRRRMADALSAFSSGGRHGLTGVMDDVPIDLTDRLSVVFRRAPELVSHGNHLRDINGLTCLAGDDGQAVLAWLETFWEGAPVQDDAKPTLRAELGKGGIVAQFLNANYTPKKPRRRRDGTIPEPEDHPAQAALRDLLRQAGVVDNRLAAATISSRLAQPLTKAATLVGVHIRQHTPRRRNGVKESIRLVVQLVAIHASPDQDTPWSVEMYDDTEGWISYRQANARYYAADIGNATFGRSREKAPLVREYVDQALSALPRKIPLVVFVEAEACRGLWRGLNNGSFGGGPLPGSTINHPDLAVVRCASGSNAPRPSHQSHTRRVTDPYKPDLPRAELYEHEEGGVLSYILAQPSRIHRSGAAGRAGTDFTRWTLPADRDRWIAGDWHALTAIEIAVAQSGSWRHRELAALTARLCNQAASWDDRTRLPTPLHLAKTSDDDHPGHPPADESSDRD